MVLQADLYDPVQHDSEANADDPRKEVADDRGDPSIVTSKLRHHLDNVYQPMSKKVHLPSMRIEPKKPPGRNSAWEKAKLLPERF